MTTIEDLDRIAVMHAMLAVREHELRLSTIASPTTFGADHGRPITERASPWVLEPSGVDSPCAVA